MAKRTRVMYIESKAEGLSGPARIARITFNSDGRTLYYKDKSFQSLKGSGFKANHYETETGDEYCQVRIVMDWTASTAQVRCRWKLMMMFMSSTGRKSATDRS